MDEKGFRKFLERGDKDETTIRFYIGAVKKFEKWLKANQYKRLIDADEHDIRSWTGCITQANYLHGLKQYYTYKPQKDKPLIATIDKMIPKLIQRPRASQDSFGWIDFRRIMSIADERNISDRDRALLNLLWSEMKSHEILDLLISDIDFENCLIRTRRNGTVYHLTKEAWEALEKYIPKEDRAKTIPLFPTPKVSMSKRNLERITKKYFDSVKKKPKHFLKHCKDDLMNVGRETRFVYKSDKRPSGKRRQKERPTFKKNLFKRLVDEIVRFGSRKDIQERVKKVKNEKEFQTLLEGYLFAVFPDQRITREVPFKGVDSPQAKIDFVVGKDERIPVEVKLAKEKMRPHLGTGSAQVKEFLRYSGTRKGILVIGDQERDPERQEYGGMQDRVYIVVI